MNTFSTKYSPFKKKPGKTKAFFICLVIASFLWLAHSLNTVYTYSFRVPVLFRNMPQNKKPMGELPDHVFVDAKASGLKLLLILLNEPYRQMEIDFNNLVSVNRNRNYVLSASHLDFSSSLKFNTQIKRINPDTLYFSERTGFQKIVPIKVPMELKCVEGFACKKPTVLPSFITIWGDTDVIESIDTIYTQPLTLSNISQNVNASLEFIKPSQKVYTTVNETNVTIEVARLLEQSLTIPITDIHHQPHQQVNFYPSSVKLRFTSLQNNFNTEDTALFKATINSSHINAGTHKSPVMLSTVPGNVTIMDYEPKEVDILILKK